MNVSTKGKMYSHISQALIILIYWLKWLHNLSEEMTEVKDKIVVDNVSQICVSESLFSFNYKELF